MGNLCGNPGSGGQGKWSDVDKINMKKRMSEEDYKYFYEPKAKKSVIRKIVSK
jgi:hypothetical protein